MLLDEQNDSAEIVEDAANVEVAAEEERTTQLTVEVAKTSKFR